MKTKMYNDWIVVDKGYDSRSDAAEVAVEFRSLGRYRNVRVGKSRRGDYWIYVRKN